MLQSATAPDHSSFCPPAQRNLAQRRQQQQQPAKLHSRSCCALPALHQTVKQHFLHSVVGLPSCATSAVRTWRPNNHPAAAAPTFCRSKLAAPAAVNSTHPQSCTVLLLCASLCKKLKQFGHPQFTTGMPSQRLATMRLLPMCGVSACCCSR